MTVHPKFFGISMFPSVHLENIDVIDSILNVFETNDCSSQLYGETVKQ
ncbi:hypothetical protein YDYSY3_32270 [Paenibacillus chitinolyticus]|nr:hypothetical protein YDYSY3_32270 [Paenibacillus chitinolyticus]